MKEHENTNQQSDGSIFSWLIKNGVTEWLATKLQAFWKTITRIGGKVLLTGETIVVEQVKFSSGHPYMTVGAVMGFSAALLLNQIPVVGWLIGPAVSCLATIVGAYLGHLADKPDGNIISFFYVILDVVYRIFKQVSNPEKNEEVSNCVFAESAG
jgi:hypothetical protein